MYRAVFGMRLFNGPSAGISAGLRRFGSSRVLANAEMDRAREVVEKLRSNAKIVAQLHQVKLAMGDKAPAPGSSLMTQMAILSDPKVREELTTLAAVVRGEGIELTPQDAQALMKLFNE